MSEAELAPPPGPPAANGTPPGPPGPALDSVPLPDHLTARLIQYALRTEPGAALWEGYAAALAGEHPWLTGRVAFYPGPGTVTPAPADAR